MSARDWAIGLGVCAVVIVVGLVLGDWGIGL